FLLKMLLKEPEIQHVLDQAKAAFPNLIDWENNSEKNGEYFGFSMWGEFVLNAEELMPRRFFTTLNTGVNEIRDILADFSSESG
ncbi:MAG: hypothetical protein ACYT04_84340, partial [Nostoc sp.]